MYSVEYGRYSKVGERALRGEVMTLLQQEPDLQLTAKYRTICSMAEPVGRSYTFYVTASARLERTWYFLDLTCVFDQRFRSTTSYHEGKKTSCQTVKKDLR